MATKEQMKAHALQMMEALEFPEKIIDMFYDGLVCVGVNGNYCIPNDKEKAIIKRVEESTGCMVYYATYTKTEFGELLTMPVASKYEEDWANDVEGAKEGYVFSWVENLDIDYFSEFGYVILNKNNGILERVE